MPAQKRKTPKSPRLYVTVPTPKGPTHMITRLPATLAPELIEKIGADVEAILRDFGLDFRALSPSPWPLTLSGLWFPESRSDAAHSIALGWAPVGRMGDVRRALEAYGETLFETVTGGAS